MENSQIHPLGNGTFSIVNGNDSLHLANEDEVRKLVAMLNIYFEYELELPNNEWELIRLFVYLIREMQ